jgi:hypothetical protein
MIITIINIIVPQCKANYYSFPGPQDEGCQFCECRVEGSIGNR